MRNSNWEIRNRFETVDLMGRRVLVLGYGRIGREVAKRCAAFEMAVTVYDPYVQANVIEADGYRSVPDFRNKIEAKSALLYLTQTLRRRGLNLQSAKTDMLCVKTARADFQGVVPILRDVKERFVQMVKELANIGDAYITLGEADRLAAEYDEADSTDILRQALRDHFLNGQQEFNGTLFRFILNRLRKQEDDFAQDYCLSILEDHPEETTHILRYLESIGNTEVSFAKIADFLESGQAIYDYQKYQIFEWISSLDEEPCERLKSIAREKAFDNARPSYLRAVCRRIVGLYPTIADLERIETSYAQTAVPMERAQILCDLRKLETGRRNSILARARRDHALCDRAAQLVRNNQV